MPDHASHSTRFVADAMLGSLARKMRALGFDTTYYSEGDDEGILRVGRAQGRVILTADKALADRARHGSAIALLISGRSDGRRLASLLVAAKLSGVGLSRGRPFCSLCDGVLRKVRRADVAGRVPLMVERRHRVFYRCTSCGQYYWKGSHWKKLRWLERVVAEVHLDTVS